MANYVAVRNWEQSAPIRVECGKDYSLEVRRSSGARSDVSPRGEMLSGAGILAGANELSSSPKLRLIRARQGKANRFSDVISSFRDLPKEKACDWIAGECICSYSHG